MPGYQIAHWIDSLAGHMFPAVRRQPESNNNVYPLSASHACISVGDTSVTPQCFHQFANTYAYLESATLLLQTIGKESRGLACASVYCFLLLHTFMKATRWCSHSACESD